VGDAEFQKRCLGKMGEVASGGRTVLFVSHNMAAVSALCGTGVHLHQGTLAAAGPVGEIVASYTRPIGASRSVRQLPPKVELGLVESSVEYAVASAGTRLVLCLSIRAKHALSASIDFRLKDAFGLPVAFASLGALAPSQLVSFQAGMNNIVVDIPADGLATGNYNLSIDLTDPGVSYYDQVEDCLRFSVDSINSWGTLRPMQQSWGYGSFLLPAYLITQSGTGAKCSRLQATT
jgi:lipopolysaccharide transport system ATP-binding protein